MCHFYVIIYIENETKKELKTKTKGDFKMKNIIIELRKELEGYGFPTARANDIEYIMDSGMGGRLVASNDFYDAEDKVGLNVRAISDHELEVEISFSNQKMNEDKLRYLQNVMQLVWKANRKLMKVVVEEELKDK